MKAAAEVSEAEAREAAASEAAAREAAAMEAATRRARAASTAAREAAARDLLSPSSALRSDGMCRMRDEYELFYYVYCCVGRAVART